MNIDTLGHVIAIAAALGALFGFLLKYMQSSRIVSEQVKQNREAQVQMHAENKESFQKIDDKLDGLTEDVHGIDKRVIRLETRIGAGGATNPR